MITTTNTAGALGRVRFLARSIAFATLALFLCLGMAGTANAQNNAAFVSQTVPGSMTANQSYAVSVTMMNNGGSTWTVGDYYLRSQNPQDNTKWDLNRVELPNAVAPGENVTFSFSVKPTLNGTTSFQWRMAQGATSFGALTTNVNVVVSGTNTAAFVSQNVPSVMVPGQLYAVSVTMQNTGTNTWSEANGYRLFSYNPWGTTTWGNTQVAPPVDVPPGASATFSFNITAPSTPGVYNFQRIMGRGSPFLQPSANVAVQVNGTNDSQFVSKTVPGVMTLGQTYPVSVTMRNTGTAPWVPGNYFLGSENPQANNTWGLNRVELAAPVAPGASVTFNFNVSAPVSAGTYDFQWRMVQNSTRFGAFTTDSSVIVAEGNNAAVVSQSVVEVMTPGQVYAASVTMQNTGGTTWTVGSYFLGSENPQANTTWGLNRVDLTAPVAPGANVTLNFNVTSPSTAGAYNFQWRMVQDSTRFGAFTTNVAVNVQQAQAQNLYYVHADHLNTPRLVADASQTTVWKWEQQEPFGTTTPNEDPDNNSVVFEFPLRFPGQYADKETALYYNVRRDYASDIGRYVESDPIGLRGGVNTYAYVDSNSLSFIDPLGLQGLSRNRGRPNEVPGRERPEPAGPISSPQNSAGSQALVRKYECYINCRNEIRGQCDTVIAFCSAAVIVFAETGPVAVVGAAACIGVGLAVRNQVDGYCSSTCGFN